MTENQDHDVYEMDSNNNTLNSSSTDNPAHRPTPHQPTSPPPNYPPTFTQGGTQSQPARGPGSAYAPPPQHVTEAMQYMMQQMAMNMMWNNPYAWQPPYGQGEWGMDYGYEGAPHPEDVPRPAPAPVPTQVPPPPSEPPTQQSSGSGTHQAGASLPRSPPPQQPPPQHAGTGQAPTYNPQAGGQGKGAGNP